MKRFLIGFAALAIWAVDQDDAAAQSGSLTGSYQSILSQIEIPDYDQVSSYGPTGYNVGYQENAVTVPPQQPTQQSFGYAQSAAPFSNAGAPGRISAGSGCNGGGGCGGGCNGGAGCGSAIGVPFGGLGYNGADQGYSYDNYASGAGCSVVDTAFSQGSAYATGGPGRFRSRNSGQRNLTYGLYGLIFDRDYEDDVFLTRNPAGMRLLSTDADSGTLSGTEFFLGSRSSAGNGWELRYWGLFADEASYSLAGVSFDSYLTDLQNTVWPGTGDTVLDVFNRGMLNTVTRDNEFHNVELNFLRNGGCYTTRSGRSARYELLAGFRWFEFDEEFRWDVTGAAAPTSLLIDTEVQNTLLGFQMGGRSEICLSRRMRLNAGTKLGIFNNRARARQVITDQLGAYATVNGVDYNFRDAKNDVSLLGELNIGTAFHITPASRLVVGYRAIGVSGIALAPDQLNNFNTEEAIRDVQSNNDLILHGSFFGLELCR